MGCCGCLLSFLEPIYAHLHVSMFDVWGHVGWLSHLFHRLLMITNNNIATLSFTFLFLLHDQLKRSLHLAHRIIRFTCPPSQMQRNSLQSYWIADSNSWAACTRRLFVGADIVIVRLCSCVALFHSTHSHNMSYQTNSELKHGHNKVDVPPERRRFSTAGQSMYHC
jgi:hypothetical protein